MIYVAIKANPDPVLLSVLAQLGSSFDCASMSEMKQALSLVNPAKIMFAHPCKPSSHIE